MIFFDHIMMEVFLFQTAEESHKIIHTAISIHPGHESQLLVNAPTAFLKNCVSSLHDIIVIPFFLGGFLAFLFPDRKPSSFGLLFDRLLLWKGLGKIISGFSGSDFLSLVLFFLRL